MRKTVPGTAEVARSLLGPPGPALRDLKKTSCSLQDVLNVQMVGVIIRRWSLGSGQKLFEENSV